MNKIKQILFIDDDEINNFILKEIFESQYNDVKVTFYTEAAQALAYVEGLVEGKEDPVPDIVFLDIKMPEMDGFDFLDSFEQKGLHEKFQVPIFMLTSSVNQRDISRASSYKTVKELITKPLTFDKLQELENRYY